MDSTAPSKTQLKKNAVATRVVDVHSHFHINRNPHEAHDGPVTPAEQLKALERFVRWHQRQVEVGQRMLTWMRETQVVADASVDSDAISDMPAATV